MMAIVTEEAGTAPAHLSVLPPPSSAATTVSAARSEGLVAVTEYLLLPNPISDRNPFNVIASTVIGLMLGFSIVTNVLVVRIFLSKRYGKVTTAKILYANISVSDLIFIVAGMIQNILFGAQCSSGCRIAISYVTKISGNVSAYTMVLISFKRWYSIAYPMKASSSPRWQVLTLLLLIWATSAALPFIFSTYYRNDVPLHLSGQCLLIYGAVKAEADRPFMTLILMVLLPLALVSFFSFRAAALLRARKQPGHLTPAQTRARRVAKLRSILMIFVVGFAFACCWLPITIFYTYEKAIFYRRIPCDYNHDLFPILIVALMLSFGINPIIYCYLNTDFRRGLKSMGNALLEWFRKPCSV